MEQVQKRVTKMSEGLETKSHEERLRDMGILSLETRRSKEDVIALFKSLKGGHLEEGRMLLHLAAQGRAHNNSLKSRAERWNINVETQSTDQEAI